MKTHAITLLALTLFLVATSKAAVPEPFRVVFIDDQSAAKFGGYPIPRKVLAASIEAIAVQKPRGIILKLFIDQPKDGLGDQALAWALTKAPVMLQAKIDDSEPNPNPMPERFFLKGLPSDLKVAVSGKSGWLPLGLLSTNAYEIGFVDCMSPNFTPLIERYQGRYVKSLYLCALEMSLKEKATLEGRELKIAKRRLTLNERFEAPVRFPEHDDLEYLGFDGLLEGKLAQGTFTDKIVILGYDGDKIDKMQTPIGQLKLHRVFCYALFDIYARMQR